MIHLSIYDGSLETPFREIGATLSSEASYSEILHEALELVEAHEELREGITPMQKKYHEDD